MAKIVITIEDKPDGNVSVVSSPNFAEIMNNMEAEDRTTGLSGAEGYAIFALNAIRNESKKKEPIKLRLPRLFRKK